MFEHDLSRASWRKSSRSNGNGGNDCVEVAELPHAIAIRDSKYPGGTILVFGRPDLASLLERIKAAELDL